VQQGQRDQHAHCGADAVHGRRQRRGNGQAQDDLKRGLGQAALYLPIVAHLGPVGGEVLAEDGLLQVSHRGQQEDEEERAHSTAQQSGQPAGVEEGLQHLHGGEGQHGQNESAHEGGRLGQRHGGREGRRVSSALVAEIDFSQRFLFGITQPLTERRRFSILKKGAN